MPIGNGISRTKKTTTGAIGSALRSIGSRMRNIEAQIEYCQPKYTVADSGFLIAAANAGAVFVECNTYPYWCVDDQAWILIDAGTTEAELRKVTSVVAGSIPFFASALQYNHSAGDPVMFLPNSVVNVLWFGAKGDGVADDTLSIQRVIDQFERIVMPGRIYLPSGTYRVFSTLSIGAAAATTLALEGDGIDKTIIMGDDGVIGDIILEVAKERTTIRDLTITQDAGSEWAGIHATSCSYLTIERVKFLNLHANQIEISSSLYPRILSCILEGGSHYGIYLDTNSQGQLVRNCVISGFVSQGIYILHTNDYIVEGNYLYNCGSGVATGGILVNASYRGVVSGNIFINPTVNSRFLDCLDLVIQGNVCYAGATPTYGIAVEGSSRVTISGNITYSHATAGIYNNGNTELLMWNNQFTEATKVVSAGSPVRNKRNCLHTEWVAPEDFIAVVGTPIMDDWSAVFAYSPFLPVSWRFANSVLDGVGGWWRVPSNFVGTTFKIGINIYWTHAGHPHAHNAVLKSSVTPVSSGGSLTGAIASDNDTTVSVPTAPDTGWDLHVAACPSVTVKGADAIRLRIGRNGASASDNFDGYIWIVGVEVTFQ